MMNEPGHIVRHATGHKLKTVDDLPAGYRDLAVVGYTHTLTAKPTES
jgi:adenylosuccinate lyase